MATPSPVLVTVRPLCLPDIYIDQDKPEKMYQVAGLDAAHIVARAMAALGAEYGVKPARA